VLTKKGKLGRAAAENRVLQWLAGAEDARSGDRRDEGASWPMCLPLPILELQLLRLWQWKRWYGAPTAVLAEPVDARSRRHQAGL
jgi:hypothetical protein